MPSDAFYSSPAWRKTRAAILERDNHQCTSAGCTSRAFIVDHIISRRNGGTSHPSNLRSLCRACDNRIKEDAAGKRRGGGTVRQRIGADGWPIDELSSS